MRPRWKGALRDIYEQAGEPITRDLLLEDCGSPARIHYSSIEYGFLEIGANIIVEQLLYAKECSKV